MNVGHSISYAVARTLSDSKCSLRLKYLSSKLRNKTKPAKRHFISRFQNPMLNISAVTKNKYRSKQFHLRPVVFWRCPGDWVHIKQALCKPRGIHLILDWSLLLNNLHLNYVIKHTVHRSSFSNNNITINEIAEDLHPKHIPLRNSRNWYFTKGFQTGKKSLSVLKPDQRHICTTTVWKSAISYPQSMILGWSDN